MTIDDRVLADKKKQMMMPFPKTAPTPTGIRNELTSYLAEANRKMQEKESGGMRADRFFSEMINWQTLEVHQCIAAAVAARGRLASSAKPFRPST